MELYYNAGRPRAANVTPFKRGFAEREGIIIQNDSDAGVSASQWMDMCLK
ncbi:hypothetical protein KC19_N032300 [Ceratodon purpureus]|nr:hypothetical protein KC19_N032300 [Ceratodon purpureus]